MNKRNIKDVSVVHFRRKMNKRGTTEWTMAKLLTIILAVFLLVIIIYGVQNKGFGPLVENIKGRFYEVQILLGIRDDGILKCGDAFPETIDGMSGDFYPCEDSCRFVLDGGNSLLGFTNFSIKGDGLTVSGDGVSDNDEAYRFGSAEAQRHKDAYDLLNNTVGEFLVKESMEYGDFVGDMGFDRGRTLVIESRHLLNEVYEYDGENWNNGKISGSKFKRKRGTSGDSSVFSDFYKSYSKGKAYWRFNEVGSLVDDVVLVGDVNRGDFKEWFYETKSEFEVKRLAGEVSSWNVRINNIGYTNDYSYTWNGKEWTGYSDNTPLDVNDAQVISNLYGNYKEDRDDVYWKDNSDVVYRRVVSDVNIKEKVSLMNKDELRKWLDGIKGDWAVKKEAQDDLKISLEESPILSDFVVGDKVIEGDHKVAMISYVSDGERFGLYYMDGVEKLFYNTDDSIVSDFVGRSDWDHFIKINKIYEHFKVKRCGNE